jgi:predicted SAM-dependent methyltransferase
MRLNLGCSDDIRPGWVNVDRVRLPGVDLVMNLAEPWQFADSTVDEIYQIES